MKLIKQKINDFKSTDEAIFPEVVNNKKYPKLKAALILSINSIKKRLFRMLSVIIVIGLSIASIVTVININIAGRTIAENVDKNYMETDLISIQYDHQPMMSLGRKPIDSEFISGLLRNSDINEMVEVYRGQLARPQRI